MSLSTESWTEKQKSIEFLETSAVGFAHSQRAENMSSFLQRAVSFLERTGSNLFWFLMSVVSRNHRVAQLVNMFCATCSSQIKVRVDPLLSFLQQSPASIVWNSSHKFCLKRHFQNCNPLKDKLIIQARTSLAGATGKASLQSILRAQDGVTCKQYNGNRFCPPAKAPLMNVNKYHVSIRCPFSYHLFTLCLLN